MAKFKVRLEIETSRKNLVDKYGEGEVKQTESLNSGELSIGDLMDFIHAELGWAIPSFDGMEIKSCKEIK